jgi:hypothetical protein
MTKRVDQLSIREPVYVLYYYYYYYYYYCTVVIT